MSRTCLYCAVGSCSNTQKLRVGRLVLMRECKNSFVDDCPWWGDWQDLQYQLGTILNFIFQAASTPSTEQASQLLLLPFPEKYPSAERTQTYEFDHCHLRDSVGVTRTGTAIKNYQLNHKAFQSAGCTKRCEAIPDPQSEVSILGWFQQVSVLLLIQESIFPQT